MKLNLKKLCLLLSLCIATVSTMPKVFASNDEPENQPSVAQPDSVRIRKKFNNGDDEKLAILVEQFKKAKQAKQAMQDVQKNGEDTIPWDEIGKLMDRSGSSCKNRYYTYLSKRISNETGTLVAQLTSEVPTGKTLFSIKCDIAIVMYYLMNDKCMLTELKNQFGNIHSASAYYKRFNNYLKPAMENKEIINRDTPDVCEKIKILVENCNQEISTWKDVAKQSGCYKAMECAGIYLTWYVHNISKKPWSDEEDNRLIRFCNSLRCQGVGIVKHFAGRTDTDVQNRLETLLKQRKILQPTSNQTNPKPAPIQNDSYGIVNYDLEYYDYFDPPADDSKTAPIQNTFDANLEGSRSTLIANPNGVFGNSDNSDVGKQFASEYRDSTPAPIQNDFFGSVDDDFDYYDYLYPPADDSNPAPIQNDSYGILDDLYPVGDLDPDPDSYYDRDR